MRFKYEQTHNDFLKQHTDLTLTEITELFNKTFDTSLTIHAIKNHMYALKLHPKSSTKILITEEQHNFIKENANKYNRKELGVLFNQTFNTNYSWQYIKKYCQQHNFTSKCGDGKFTSETSPRWQKGLTKEEYKSHYTEESFKKAITHMIDSNKTHKIGDIIEKQGKLFIVISLDYDKPFYDRIEPYARYIWKQHNGDIPNDYMIIHLDNNPKNCDINNLRCIPQKYRTFLGYNKWWNIDKDAKLAALQYCELFYLIKDLKEN